MDTATGLLPYLAWCVQAFAPEAESAARWADQFLAFPDRHERARRMIGDLSARVSASGTPRAFVEEFPGVRGGLQVETAYMVFRMVKIHMYVAAAHGIPLVDLPLLEDQSLLLMGAELGLAPFESAVSDRGGASDVLRRRFPGSRAEAAALLQDGFESRVGRLAQLPFAGALRGALEFLTFASATDLANAYYDDMVLRPEEVTALSLHSAERAVSVLGLLKLTARADGAVSRQEEGLLEALRQVVPAVDPQALQRALGSLSLERLPQVLTFAEERQGLLQCMLAMASADARLDPVEERLCRDVADLLEIPQDQVDRAISVLPLLKA